jgi:hypothetical protein
LLELESPYSGSPISFSIALPIAIAVAVAVFRLLQVIYLIFAITTFPSRLAILSYKFGRRSTIHPPAVDADFVVEEATNKPVRERKNDFDAGKTIIDWRGTLLHL